MSRRTLVPIFILSILLFTGCTNQAEVIEVTREIVSEVPVTVDVEVTRVVAAAVEPETVEVTRIVTELVELPPLGSEERPIQLVISPLLEEQITSFRGQTLVDDLMAATGLAMELVVAESFAETVAAVCDRPDQTIAILPGPLSVLAREQCDAQPEFVAAKNGVPWTASMLLVRGDQGIFELEDLNGRTWGIPSEESWESYLYFQAFLAEQGITPGEITVENGQSNAVLAVYNNEVEFATASFLPPLLPLLAEWQYGVDDPEIWRSLGLLPIRHPIGFVIVLARAEDGGYQIRDARAAVFDVERDIFSFTTILTLSGRFPNETIVFGSEIPLGTARNVGEALQDYVTTDACEQSVCSGDFYIWTGLAPVNSETFADVEFTIESLQMSDDDLLARFD
ncbi:MAG: PhnD/SsuA/transferrin family substrate-binding protein [Anaerolineales bacterium]|nr:PhnD/SsuA/transferrin family substrate-binding protein [Anaerolineales bacterium]